MTKSLFIGSTKIHLAEVDSTNNYARRLISDKLPIEGTLITADSQLNGRGQRSNLWVTEPNLNITCTYILHPAFLAARNQFYLSAAVALAVYETVLCFSGSSVVRIKWPNDILVGEQKIAGILIENTLKRMNLGSSIVGIGLNVNQDVFQSGINATSLKLLEAKKMALKEVQEILNISLEKYYLQLKNGKMDEILIQFNSVLFGVNTKRNLHIDGKQETVKIAGVKPSGELELQRENGNKTSHQHHEIDWNLSRR